MLLAERWLGFGTIIACALALTPQLLPTAPAPTPHIVLTPHRCTEHQEQALAQLQVQAVEHRVVRALRTPRPLPPPINDNDADPYTRVFEHARPQLASCFGAETRVELLITIDRDGRVADVSHQSDPSTPASGCLTAVVQHLKFPASPTTI